MSEIIDTGSRKRKEKIYSNHIFTRESALRWRQRARNRATADPVDDGTVEDLTSEIVLDEKVERVGLVILFNRKRSQFCESQF